MRGLLLVGLLVTGSGCRAIADRQGLLGAAREARDWVGTLAVPAVESAALADNSWPGEVPVPTPVPLQAASNEPSLAASDDPPARSRPAKIALPVSVSRLPPAESEDEAAAAEPARVSDESAEEVDEPASPLAALRALLLQPPRVGASPPLPTAHPTPARATWRQMERAAPAVEPGDSADDVDAHASPEDSEREEAPVRVGSPAPPRSRKLPQPPIPLSAAGTNGATGGTSSLPWRKPSASPAAEPTPN